MRNFLILMVAGLVVVFAAEGLRAGQYYDSKIAVQQAKARHKEERKALKFKQQSVKEYWKTHPVSKAMRLQIKHQQEREWRELREKQKDELQNLRDQQRVVTESQKAYPQAHL